MRNDGTASAYTRMRKNVGRMAKGDRERRERTERRESAKKKSRYVPRRCDAEKALELSPLLPMLRRLNDRQLRDCKKALGKLRRGAVSPHVITRAVYPSTFAGSDRRGRNWEGRGRACVRMPVEKRFRKRFRAKREEKRRKRARDWRNEGWNKEKDDSLLASGRRYTRKKVRDLFRAFCPPPLLPTLPVNIRLGREISDMRERKRKRKRVRE